MVNPSASCNHLALLTAGRVLASAALEAFSYASARAAEPWNAYDLLALEDRHAPDPMDVRLTTLCGNLRQLLNAIAPHADRDTLEMDQRLRTICRDLTQLVNETALHPEPDAVR